MNSYQYNGLGDRLVQNGTQYTLDLNAGLTQVLDDGENSYVYGLGRISQTNVTNTEYFLGDALGSVRQMTDTAGEIKLVKNYEPYGTVSQSAGDSQSAYGFTGEYTDSTGNVYLRARYYNPLDGRFMSRDTWGGDVNNPLSLNRWNYVEGNPVNYVDPSGYIKEGAEAKEAELILEKLNNFYDVEIKKDWGYAYTLIGTDIYDIKSYDCVWQEGNWRNIDELKTVYEGIKITAKGMGGASKFKIAMNNYPIRITRININGDVFRHRAFPVIDIVYSNYGMTNANYIIYTTVHELGHIWDLRTNTRLSREMADLLGTYNCVQVRGGEICEFDVSLGKEPPPGNNTNPYAGTNALEDWAESFANYIYPLYYAADLCTNSNTTNCNLPIGPLRNQYVTDKINSLK